MNMSGVALADRITEANISLLAPVLLTRYMARTTNAIWAMLPMSHDNEDILIAAFSGVYDWALATGIKTNFLNSAHTIDIILTGFSYDLLKIGLSPE